MALVALGGAALVAGAVVKLLSSRPRFQKLGEGRAYGTPEGAEPDAAWVSTYKTGVTVPFDGCDTLYAVFQASATRE